MSLRPTRFVRCGTLLLSSCVAFIMGCDPEPQRPEIHPVRGELFVNDEPAAGALLSFHPADGKNFDERGSRPWATVHPDGRFEMSTYGQGDGAPQGNYFVSIVWLNHPDSASPVDRLQGRYADPRISGWQVTVGSGETVLPRHEIQAARIAPPRQSAGSIEPLD